MLALVIVTALALSGGLFLRGRLSQREQQLREELQALIDLEWRALVEGDRELYLSLQGREDPAWFRRQAQTFEERARRATPHRRVQVTGIEIAEPYAWAHATVGASADGLPNRTLFYRYQDGAWRSAPPDPRFWGAEREMRLGRVRFVYREGDEPFLPQLATDMTALWDQLCATLGCPADLPPTVRVLVDADLPAASPSAIWITSPSLSPGPSPRAHLLTADLVTDLAFRQLDGDHRWTRTLAGAWLVGAAANWAGERLWEACRTGRVAVGGPLLRETPSPAGEAQAAAHLWRLLPAAGEPACQGWKWFSLRNENGRQRLGRLVSTGQVLPLGRLWQAEAGPDLGRYTNAYAAQGAQALGLIDYVAARCGHDALPDLLAAIDHHTQLDAALQEALNLDSASFEAAWSTWLQERYGGDAATNSTLDRYTVYAASGGDARWTTSAAGQRLVGAVAYWEELRHRSLPWHESEMYGYGRELMHGYVHAERVLALAAIWDGPPQGDGHAADGALISYPNTVSNAHALSVVRYIAQTHGDGALQELLRAIGANETLQGALREGLGTTVAAFEPGWRAWLEAQYGLE